MTVICSSTPWRGTKFQDRHLAEHLSRLRPVLFVDPPRSAADPLRHRDAPAGNELDVIRPGLARLTVMAPPWPERPAVAALSEALVRRGLRRAVGVLGARVDTLISSSTIINPFGACSERLRVYWAQDDQVGGAHMTGFSPRRVAEGERRMVDAADVVVASNPEVAEAWRAAGRDVTLIPFGCDVEMFARTDATPAAPDVRLSGPIAGFIGGLVPERIDVPALAAVAEAGHSVLLVGPAHARQGTAGLEAVLQRPNVQWVGPRPFEELPSYMRHIDVGLVPYADTAFNRGSFPLKTLEYLAAGRPVVATDLPAIRWLGTGLVDMAGDPVAFAAAVGRQLDRLTVPPGPDPGEGAARERLARSHSWDARARDFAGLLDSSRRVPA